MYEFCFWLYVLNGTKRSGVSEESGPWRGFCIEGYALTGLRKSELGATAMPCSPILLQGHM